MNPKYHLLVAVAALSLGACSTDDTCTGPENGEYKISFTVAEDPETRTTLDKGDFLRWVPTDEVGIYTVGNNKNPNTFTVADVNQSPVEFIGTLKYLVSKGDQFYAYYPYDKEQSIDPTAVKLTIPSAQTQTQAGVYNGESHPLVALPMKVEWERDSKACRMSSVRFRQLGAIVELQLYSSNEALRNELIRSVTFESETPLAGDFTFDLTTVTDKEEPQISVDESKVVTTLLEESAVIPATKDEAALVYLTIAPGQYLGKIVVKTDVAHYTFRLKNPMDFERAGIKGLAADLSKVERKVLSPDGPASENDPILFEDPIVAGICVENWDTSGDGELSYKEAAAVTSIGNQFQIAQKTLIRSFNELQYFTGLKSIGSSAFYNCSSLKSINIPDGVTSIGLSAFYGCSSLTSINIPDGVTAIGIDAFYGCSSLTSLQLPDGVTSIGNYTFEGCSSLTSINIPEGVTSIGVQAFSGCSSLTSINIPKKVSSIGEQAFCNCSSLSAFYGKYASTDNRCLIQYGALLAFAPAGLTEYTIPDKVIAIGNNTFYGCSSLTSITIPEEVTAIGEEAFNRCSSLTSVYCKPTTPPTLGNNAFLSTPSSMQIYVPTASVEAYKTAKGWSGYASRIFADNN